MGQLHTVHMVRHGEVHNPDHVVYADLPGFGLSEHGRSQAGAAATRLAGDQVDVVLSSPLERAVETAEIIAAPHALDPVTDDRLVEWRMGDAWAGLVWEDLPRLRPGQLEAYLANPARLDFTDESLDQLAKRVVAAMDEWAVRYENVIVVSHQDPVQAACRLAARRGLDSFHTDKPGHASVTTLVRSNPDDAFHETAYWEPDQGPRFPPIDE